MNFKNYPNGFLLMFSTVTGYNWEDTMFECFNTVDKYVFTEIGLFMADFICHNDQEPPEFARDGPRGCGNLFAYPFFISYVLLVKLMITNLILVLSIEGYLSSRSIERLIVEDVILDIFWQKWAEYDENSSGLIKPEHFVLL